MIANPEHISGPPSLFTTEEVAEKVRGYMPQSKSQEWGTPKEFFDDLDKEFHFTVDVCASYENRKCLVYFDKDFDGLKQAWHGVAFCNPPYGAKEIRKWVVKAIEERLRGTTTVMLVPNTTDVGWFHELIYSYELRSFLPGIECRFVKGRINFDPPPGQESISNVKGSMLIIIKPISPPIPCCPLPAKFQSIYLPVDGLVKPAEDWQSKFEDLSLKHQKLRGFVKELGRNVSDLNINISTALDVI